MLQNIIIGQRNLQKSVTSPKINNFKFYLPSPSINFKLTTAKLVNKIVCIVYIQYKAQRNACYSESSNLKKKKIVHFVTPDFIFLT